MSNYQFNGFVVNTFDDGSTFVAHLMRGDKNYFAYNDSGFNVGGICGEAFWEGNDVCPDGVDFLDFINKLFDCDFAEGKDGDCNDAEVDFFEDLHTTLYGNGLSFEEFYGCFGQSIVLPKATEKSESVKIWLSELRKYVRYSWYEDGVKYDDFDKSYDDNECHYDVDNDIMIFKSLADAKYFAENLIDSYHPATGLMWSDSPEYKFVDNS